MDEPYIATAMLNYSMSPQGRMHQMEVNRREYHVDDSLYHRPVGPTVSPSSFVSSHPPCSGELKNDPHESTSKYYKHYKLIHHGTRNKHQDGDMTFVEPLFVPSSSAPFTNQYSQATGVIVRRLHSYEQDQFTAQTMMNGYTLHRVREVSPPTLPTNRPMESFSRTASIGDNLSDPYYEGIRPMPTKPTNHRNFSAGHQQSLMNFAKTRKQVFLPGPFGRDPPRFTVVDCNAHVSTDRSDGNSTSTNTINHDDGQNTSSLISTIPSAMTSKNSFENVQDNTSKIVHVKTDEEPKNITSGANSQCQRKRQSRDMSPSSSIGDDACHSENSLIGDAACQSEKENKRPRIMENECNLGGATKSPKKNTTNFGMLELLCAASIQLSSQIHEGKGCSCPRSRCIKLYCECFQEGRKCSKDTCSCKKCKNTDVESGPNGARTKAIQGILSRNPHAFSKDKPVQDPSKITGLACRCVKSQCLKLYCDCFQSGKVCNSYCLCRNCLNTEAESGENGQRTIARELCIERNPTAFEAKVKKVGEGCACKNSRCLKKYCDCFSSGLPCSDKCTCRNCANLGVIAMKAQRGQPMPSDVTTKKIFAETVLH